MAFIYIRTKNRRTADKIIEEVIKKYGKGVVCFDIENLSREVRPEEGNIYAHRKISRKGGSLYITLPSSIVNFLNLKRDDILLFVGRSKIGRVYIEKVGYQLLREQ